MNRPRTLLAIAALCCLPFSTAINSAERVDGTNATTSVDLAGDWQSSQFGTQTLSLRPDGSADLKIRLGTLAAVLYGRNLTLQLKWKLEGNLLTQNVIGGFPERSVLKLTQKFGATHIYRVIDQTSQSLTVEDVATGKTCSWNSVSSDSVAL